MDCIVLVRCVLMLRCVLAAVVWYPDAGFSFRVIYKNFCKILTLSDKCLIERNFIAGIEFSRYSEAQILHERI